MLCSKKGCNLPRTVTDLPAIGDKDKDDILFGIENGARTHARPLITVYLLSFQQWVTSIDGYLPFWPPAYVTVLLYCSCACGCYGSINSLSLSWFTARHAAVLSQNMNNWNAYMEFGQRVMTLKVSRMWTLLLCTQAFGFFNTGNGVLPRNDTGPEPPELSQVQQCSRKCSQQLKKNIKNVCTVLETELTEESLYSCTGAVCSGHVLHSQP